MATPVSENGRRVRIDNHVRCVPMVGWTVGGSWGWATVARAKRENWRC